MRLKMTGHGGRDFSSHPFPCPRIVILLVIVMIMATQLAGCTQYTQDNTTIPGRAYNETWFEVRLLAQEKAGVRDDIVRRILANDTDGFFLYYGSWSIEVWYDDTNFPIGSVDIVVETTDESFTVTIYNDTIYGWST